MFRTPTLNVGVHRIGIVAEELADFAVGIIVSVKPMEKLPVEGCPEVNYSHA